MWMMILPVVKSLGQTLIFTNVGRLILIGLALFSAWQVDRYWQRQKGAQDVVRKIEKQQTDARRKADKAGRASRDPAARGVRDPYARPADDGS